MSVEHTAYDMYAGMKQGRDIVVPGLMNKLYTYLFSKILPSAAVGMFIYICMYTYIYIYVHVFHCFYPCMYICINIFNRMHMNININISYERMYT
jgi:hypothetical protein